MHCMHEAEAVMKSARCVELRSRADGLITHSRTSCDVRGHAATVRWQWRLPIVLVLAGPAMLTNIASFLCMQCMT
jgi:hypothetical protein